MRVKVRERGLVLRKRDEIVLAVQNAKGPMMDPERAKKQVQLSTHAFFTTTSPTTLYL